MTIYTFMYNKNICCYYTSSCIIKIHFHVSHKCLLSLCIVLYETIYNKNVYCHYIRRYIITTNIFIIYRLV